MKEAGIIMSGDHPKLILDGIKTMTRRTRGLKEINEFPDSWERIGCDQSGRFSFRWIGGDRILNVRCPYGGVGDRLWVRERHRIACVGLEKSIEHRVYYADGIYHKITADQAHAVKNWASNRPAIHMNRWASRITLEITEVRVGRVQEITEADAKAEGVEKCEGFRIYPQPKEFETVNDYRMGFTLLWDSLNAKRGYGWDFNPWVWPINFKLIKEET